MFQRKKRIILFIGICFLSFVGNQKLNGVGGCDQCCNIDFTGQYVCEGAGLSNCMWKVTTGHTACCSCTGSVGCENLNSLGNHTFYYKNAEGSNVTCQWICQGTTTGSGCGDSDDTTPTEGSCMAMGTEMMGTAPFGDCGSGSTNCPGF